MTVYLGVFAFANVNTNENGNVALGFRTPHFGASRACTYMHTTPPTLRALEFHASAFKMEYLALIFVVCFNLVLFGVCCLVLLSLHWREDSGICRVQVVVLGDMGRSPRMQYHCLSLIQQHYNVDYIGYGGEFVGNH